MPKGLEWLGGHFSWGGVLTEPALFCHAGMPEQALTKQCSAKCCCQCNRRLTPVHTCTDNMYTRHTSAIFCLAECWQYHSAIHLSTAVITPPRQLKLTATDAVFCATFPAVLAGLSLSSCSCWMLRMLGMDGIWLWSAQHRVLHHHRIYGIGKTGSS